MQQLTPEQQATNFETYQHIDKVIGLLIKMQIEISKRILTHDRSKLVNPEVETFTEYTAKLKGSTYGSDEYKQFLTDMKPALDHHYSHNRHHPEFFCDGIDDMNIIDILEMLVDWKAATMRHADGDINRSIEINTNRFNMSPQLVNIFKNSLSLLADPFPELETQKDI